MNCPLCGFSAAFFSQVIGRNYHSCPNCELIFMDPKHHLPPQEEKDRYTQHENHIPDPGYIKFLHTLIDPLCKFIKPGQPGLDYGSGPYPMLAQLLEEQGYSVEVYDPFFAPTALVHKRFAWVSCCEVVEHFYQPAEEWEKITSLVLPGGILGVRTNLAKPEMDGQLFQGWHYPRDPTHTSFYHPATMSWIAKRFGLSIEFQNSVTTIFRSLGG